MKFLKKISLKIKIAFGIILGVVSFILYALVRSKMKAKDKLDYELAKLKSEMEIAKLEEETEDNLIKLEELKQKEDTIRKKIAILEQEEFEGREVSVEELDQFFKDRGF